MKKLQRVLPKRFPRLLPKKITHKLISISLKKWSIGLMSAGVLILLGLGTFWYVTVYNQKERLNERRFWSAIDTALNTRSVVKTTTAGASGKLDTNAQRIYLSGERLVQVLYTTEVNNPAQSFKLNISTEAQQYYDGDNYIRYTNYESSEGTSLGEYVGVWALQDTETIDQENYEQQYASGLVSVVPFADLPAKKRTEIINKLRDNNIYSVKVNDAITREVDGETIIQIPVTVSLRGYIEVLNEVFEVSGYPDLGLDPESVGGGTLNASIEIRARDSVVTKLTYGTIVESYSNYGVLQRPEEPTETLSYQELQQAVQEKLSPQRN